MSNTAPGWYDDGQGRRRWWDGLRWTRTLPDPEQEAMRRREDERILGMPRAAAKRAKGWTNEEILQHRRDTILGLNVWAVIIGVPADVFALVFLVNFVVLLTQV